MKKLRLEDGLLLTDITLNYKNKSLHLKRVLVDTGSGGTIVSSDMAELIGIIAEKNDMIYRISGVGGSEFVYSKKIDSIIVGNETATDFPLEIGAMNYGFNLDGIIGLDLLQRIKAIININQLTLSHE